MKQKMLAVLVAVVGMVMLGWACRAGGAVAVAPQAQGQEGYQIKMNTSLLQSAGARLMECRIKVMRKTCGLFGAKSTECAQARDIDRDGLFAAIRDKSRDEIDVLVEVDAAMKSCEGIYE